MKFPDPGTAGSNCSCRQGQTRLPRAAGGWDKPRPRHGPGVARLGAVTLSCRAHRSGKDEGPGCFCSGRWQAGVRMLLPLLIFTSPETYLACEVCGAPTRCVDGLPRDRHRRRTAAGHGAGRAARFRGGNGEGRGPPASVMTAPPACAAPGLSPPGPRVRAPRKPLPDPRPPNPAEHRSALSL